MGTAVTSAVRLPNTPRAQLDFELASESLAPGHYYLAIWIDAGLDAVVIPLDHVAATAHFQIVADTSAPFSTVWANDWGVITLPSSNLIATATSRKNHGEHDAPT